MRRVLFIYIFLIPISSWVFAQGDPCFQIPVILSDFHSEDWEQVTEKGLSCSQIPEYIRDSEMDPSLADIDEVKIRKGGGLKGSLFRTVKPGSKRDINHFFKCNGAADMIRNMAMIAIQDKCMFSGESPMINISNRSEYDELMLFLTEKTRKYQGIKLTKLPDQQDQIEKELVYELAKFIVDKQVAPLVGDNQSEIDRFINNSKTINNLASLTKEEQGEYLGRVLPLDIPFEFVDHSFSELIKSNLSSPLKEVLKDIPQGEVDSLITSKIEPRAREAYNSCIKDYKDRSLYGVSDINAVINQRNKMAKSLGEGCNKKTQYLSDKENLPDMDIIQACMIQSITQSFEPIVKELIKPSQDALGINDGELNILSVQANDQLISCIDNQLSSNGPESIRRSPERLFRTAPADFPALISKCQDKVMEYVFRQGVTKQLSEMESIKRDFASYDQVDFLGNSISRGVSDYSKKIVDEVLPACLEGQRRRGVINISPENCTDQIEMRVARDIVDIQVGKMSEDLDRKSKDIETLARSEYRECVDKEVLKSNNLGLSLNQSGFLECNTNLIVTIGTEIGMDEYWKLANENRNDLSDGAIFDKASGEVKEVLSKCISEEIEKNKTWNDFKNFSENESAMDELKKTCSVKIENLIVPKIFTQEIPFEIAKQEFIKNFEVEPILYNIIKMMGNDLGVNFSSNDTNEDKFRKIFSKFKDKKGNIGTEELIKEFKSYAKDIGLDAGAKVKLESFFSDLENRFNPGYSITELKEAVDPSCAFELYTKIKADFPQGESTSGFDIYAVINQSLEYANNSGKFESLKNKFTDICKNPSAFTMSDLGELDILRPFVMQTIKPEVSKTLYDMMKKLCLDSIRDNFTKNNHLNICEMNSSGKPKVNIENYLKNIRKKEDKTKLSFIFKSFEESLKNIDRYLNPLPGERKKFESFDEEFMNNDNFHKVINENLDFILSEFKRTNGSISSDLKSFFKDIAFEAIFQKKTQNTFASETLRTQVATRAGLVASKEAYIVARKNLGKGAFVTVGGVHRIIDYGYANCSIDWIKNKEFVMDEYRKQIVDTKGLEINQCKSSCLSSNCYEDCDKKYMDNFSQTVTNQLRPIVDAKVRKDLNPFTRQSNCYKYQSFGNRPRQAPESLPISP